MKNRFSTKAKALVAAGAATLASGVASAGELAAAFTAESAGAKAEMMLIGAAVLGVVGVAFLINRSKGLAR